MREMWTCPRCGRRFVNRNQHHGCILYDPSDLFQRRDPLGREVFELVCEMLDGFGDYTILGQKTGFAFQRRALFLMIKPRARGLELTFMLPELSPSPRVIRTAPYSARKTM